MDGHRYRDRVLAVVNHIQHHLDGSLGLGELAALVDLSPHHFHRIFRGVVGEGVAEHVRRLRLERAAQQLRHDRASITEIAFDAGFESLDGFGRAFRGLFGQTPSAYRRSGTCHKPPARSGIHYDPHRRIGRIAGWSQGSRLPVRIERRDAVEVASLARQGPYLQSAPAAFEALWRWARRRGHVGRIGRILGYGEQDPDITPADQLVYHACYVIEGDFEAKGDIARQILPGGRHAIHRHRGPYHGLRDAWVQLLGEWLPASGEAAAEGPAFEEYLNSITETPPERLLTELLLPLRPRPTNLAHGDDAMDVRIENLDPVEVAFVRRKGPYARSAKAAFDTLLRWLDRNGRGDDVRQCIGFGHHDPNVTPPEACVYDACFALEGGVAADDEVGVQTLPGGRYAILTLIGPYSGIGAGFDRLRDEVLPTCGEPTDWRPWIERYLDDPAEVPEAELRTELCMPLAGKVPSV